MMEQSFPVRVYYEDTDHAGVVYYANYLKFMERGRTEYLRACGLEQSSLQRSHGILFAVTEANIRYKTPAQFDDALEVKSRILQIKGARLSFAQAIWRGDTLISEATIHLACMDIHGKAKRIPPLVIHALRKLRKR